MDFESIQKPDDMSHHNWCAFIVAAVYSPVQTTAEEELLATYRVFGEEQRFDDPLDVQKFEKRHLMSGFEEHVFDEVWESVDESLRTDQNI